MSAEGAPTCGGCLLLVDCGRGTRCVAPKPRRGMGHRRWIQPETPCDTCSRRIEQPPLPLFGGGGVRDQMEGRD